MYFVAIKCRAITQWAKCAIEKKSAKFGELLVKLLVFLMGVYVKRAASEQDWASLFTKSQSI